MCGIARLFVNSVFSACLHVCVCVSMVVVYSFLDQQGVVAGAIRLSRRRLEMPPRDGAAASSSADRAASEPSPAGGNGAAVLSAEPEVAGVEATGVGSTAPSAELEATGRGGAGLEAAGGGSTAASRPAPPPPAGEGSDDMELTASDGAAAPPPPPAGHGEDDDMFGDELTS